MEDRFHLTSKSTTTANIVFLLLSFPLGLLYFCVTIIGLSLGMGTLVIWIGLPILFATLWLARVMGEVERRMVSSLLHLPWPYQPPKQYEPRMGFLRRFGRMLTDPYTWTSVIYMILKLPLGIISFVLALTLSLVSFSLILFPLAYLIQLLVNVILLSNGISSSGGLIPGFIEVHGSFDFVMFARSFIGVPIGIVLWLISRSVLNILALASGELARALLGPGVGYVIEQPHQSYAPPMPMGERQFYEERYASQEGSSFQG